MSGLSIAYMCTSKEWAIKMTLPEPFCEPFLFLSAFWRISFIVTFKLSTGIREKPWAAFLKWKKAKEVIDASTCRLF